MESRRDYGIDLVKALAIVSVVLIHTGSVGLGQGVRSADWLAGLLWTAPARAAVPLFLMCSGTLLLRPAQPLTMKKLFTRNLPHMLLAMLFWAMAYQCYHLLAAGGLTLAGLWQGLKEMLLFRQEFHLYYLHITLFLYLCLPCLSVFTAHASRRQMAYALAVWFAFGIVYPTVRDVWPVSLLGGIPGQWRMNMTYAAPGYALLGFSLRQRPPARRYGWAALAAGLAVVLGGTWLLSWRRGAFCDRLLEGMTVGAALLAAGIFSLCQDRQGGGRAARWVTLLGRASFCIYLVHIFFYYLLLPLENRLPLAAAVPLCAALNLGLSLAVYLALSRVPWVKRWLI